MYHGSKAGGRPVVTGSRSQQAARYGALAEAVARRRYGLDVDHTAWCDARDDSGDPWDVKAVMSTRVSPRFRLWREQHTRLSRVGGGYVFVAYRPHAEGIIPEETRAVRARDIRVRFVSAGNHPKGDQAKVPTSAIF